MPTLSALVDAYIDVNIVLVAVCLIWLGLSAGLRVLGRTGSVMAQLRLLRAGFCLAIATPAIVAVHGALQAMGAAGRSVNLSDFVVSQYLQGRFSMSPSSLETALGFRAGLAEMLGAPSGWVLGLIAVLGLGFALFAGRFGLNILRLRRVIGDSFLWRRFGRLELRLSDVVAVPFSTRTLRRRIVVLPSAMLGYEADLKIALRHEMQHLRQHDVEWEIVLELLRPVFFWNPFFYLWKRQVELYRELSCDRAVLIRHRFSVAEYCECLIRVCHSSLARRGLARIGVPAVGLVNADRWLGRRRSARVLRQRMETLIESRAEAHPGRIFGLLFVPLLGLTLLAATAIQKPADWSQDRIMLSTIVNLERLAAINTAAPSLGTPSF